jgi:phosphoserine phosphatase RsbU/P
LRSLTQEIHHALILYQRDSSQYADRGSLLFVDDVQDDFEESVSEMLVCLPHIPDAPSAVPVAPSPGAERKLSACLQISRELRGALLPDEVLAQVLNSLIMIFAQADRGFIALRNPDGTLVPRCAQAWSADGKGTIRVSRTIVNEVMETQQGILSAHVAMDEDFEEAPTTADCRLRSMMCAPLLDSHGNSFGLLQIDTVDQSKQFQQQDLEILLVAAGQAGSAIENAALRESALRQALLQRDLEFVRDVRYGCLPESRLQLAGYELFDFYRPGSEIGGEYFDYLVLPNGRVVVIVADVAGKGVSAAMQMARLSAEAQYCLATTRNAAQAMTMLNERWCRLQCGLYATAVLALLDPQLHEVWIANAGHIGPICFRRHGTVTVLGSGVRNLQLGKMMGATYETATCRLEPGDSLLMYTDGLILADAPSGESYGFDRLRTCGLASSGSPSIFGRSLVDDILAFLENHRQTNDMCFVVFGRV